MTNTFTPQFSILMVDDEPAWLRSLSITLEGRGGLTNLLQLSDSREVLPLLARQDVGLILLDLTMPYCGGEEILQQVKQHYPTVEVIILSGMNQLETAVRCMRLGAYDYFIKTDETGRLLEGVRHAVQMVELQRQALEPLTGGRNHELDHPEVFSAIVTRDAQMLHLFAYLEAIAASRHPLLILGESGVGKELFARALHDLTHATGPLVSVNVAGLDDSMFADTLFGHRKGAFTGAGQDRSGMIEQAAGGTLFLDEIGDLSIPSQVKLLRLLQEGDYYPLGADQPSLLQARIVCATHCDLEAAVNNGTFRKDLYYRLRAHQVKIPPLRERRSDIPLLLEHFLKQSAHDLGKPLPTPPQQLSSLLGSYHFPGNVRELEMMVQDALSRHRGGILSLASFQDRIGEKQVASLAAVQNPFLGLDILPTLSQATEMLIDAALERSGGNQSLAARLLGISQPALSKRLKGRRLEEKGL
ncbi:MAG: sigma-54-dependent Fis family transcriptional regulator [Desulfuromonadaceae bacterium]|nr:sigma-54-dependent Fis family transcriptional regulator [Desulfuromonadaceae bacterium]